MPSLHRALFPLAIPLCFALFAACSSEDDKTHLPGTSSASSGGGSSTGVTTGPGTTATGTGGAGGATASSGTGSDLGYCGKACAVDVDCCPQGVPNCPGPYPTNYSCGTGICQPPECASTADCSIIPNAECHPISGYGSCFVPCTVDDDCVADLVCAGQADDGTKYCTTTATGCAMDIDCHGYGKCFTGACRCQTDMDCTGMGVDTCVK